MRKILMIAYTFPPVNRQGSARPFYFAKHLPEFGYSPVVISAEPEEGSPLDETLLGELEDRVKLISVNELSLRRVGDTVSEILGRGNDSDVAAELVTGPCERERHSGGGVGFARRLWRSGHWTIPVIAAGVRACTCGSIDIIWATGDPWPSLMAAYWLSRYTGKPMVADLRDPWTYGCLWAPSDREDAAWNQQWERRILMRARRAVFTSPLTTEIMRRKYPSRIGTRFVTITNGFVEGPEESRREAPLGTCLFRFIGSLGGHRSPVPLFEGIRVAKSLDREFEREARFQFIGRGGDCESEAARFGVKGMVECLSQVRYAESRKYMRGADVLLLIQTIPGNGSDCISGKAFEYLGARRPIVAIAPSNGGDAWFVRSTGSGIVTGISDPLRIAGGLLKFWRMWRTDRSALRVRSKVIDKYSRRSTAKQLAQVFDEILEGR